MFLLIGDTGYVGSAFAAELTRRGIPFQAVNSAFLLTESKLSNLLRAYKISFVLNCAGYVGKPNVDSCELKDNRGIMLYSNVILPGTIRRVCESNHIAFGHVSTGCLFNGGAYSNGGNFSETDTVNHYSAYSRSKQLGEEVLAGGDCYIWRLRMPFNEIDDRRNYLAKLIAYNTLITECNSISHLGEFAAASVALVERNSPYGVYNVVNPNPITPREIISIANSFGLGGGEKKYIHSDSLPTVAKRSNCTLNTGKLDEQGIYLTDTREIVARCFGAWRNTSQ